MLWSHVEGVNGPVRLPQLGREDSLPPGAGHHLKRARAMPATGWAKGREVLKTVPGSKNVTAGPSLAIFWLKSKLSPGGGVRVRAARP